MATHEVAADHPMLPGHFPGDPIVPGAWLLSQVLIDAAEWLARTAPGAVVAGVRSVKFLQPVRPGQAYAIDFAAGSGSVKFTLMLGDVRCASGVLELADAA
jgi:3-hydroxymyristoyl/3-hydroxydecanoyl-(acyl carrier protein) dehydratase